MKKSLLALAACGALLAGAANATELEAESLSAAYIEKCPESIQVLVDLFTESNTVIEGTDAPAAGHPFVVDSGCGTDRDGVYKDMMRPEVIQEMNDLLAKGELDARLDADLATVANDVIKVDPLLKRAMSGVTTNEELNALVQFAFVQNRTKTIKEMAADE
jgi:hypothetical protein